MRKPGAEMTASPEWVWRKYRCKKKPLPFVDLIHNEVIPETLAAGDEINHRFIYVMCPEQATQVMTGTLYRSFFSKGEMIFEHEIENFELSPGRWIIDALVTIPAQADPGVYSIRISFSAPDPIFEKDIPFSVYKNKP